jgi:hypothetical protein
MQGGAVASAMFDLSSSIWMLLALGAGYAALVS